MDLRGMKLQWLGHATFHILTPKGTSLLIDPWLESNPACPKEWKAPNKLDMVLCTHGHSDHFGDALAVEARYHPAFVGIFELTSWLQSKGVQQAVGMNLGGSFRFQDVIISMVDAKHTSSIVDNGVTLYGGVPAGYVLQIDGASVLYHAGDTALFGDMRLIGELYAPEIACLPIGDHFTMGPRTAAMAAKMLGCKLVVPMHYGTFPVLTGTPAELRRHLAGQPVEVRALKPGETLG
jgi:L-ascorbate metabolism protein UlaG (beta-lactamase superfamily)